MSNTKAFTYKRYMRDGSTEERHAVTDNPQRVRTGKTQKDKQRKHRSNDNGDS